MVCFYCEKKQATKERFGQPSCDGCHTSFLVKQVEDAKDMLPEHELATRYKTLLKTFSYL